MFGAWSLAEVKTSALCEEKRISVVLCCCNSVGNFKFFAQNKQSTTLRTKKSNLNAISCQITFMSDIFEQKNIGVSYFPKLCAMFWSLIWNNT